MKNLDEKFWEDYQHLKREVILLRQSENRLNEIRARYKALLASPAALIAVLDKYGIFREINPQGLKILGFDEHSIIEKSAEEIFFDEDSARISENAKSVVKQRNALEFFWNISRIYGPPLKLQVYMEPIRDFTDNIQSVLIIAYDLSEKEKLESEISVLKEINQGLEEEKERLLKDKNN